MNQYNLLPEKKALTNDHVQSHKHHSQISKVKNGIKNVKIKKNKKIWHNKPNLKATKLKTFSKFFLYYMTISLEKAPLHLLGTQNQ